MRAVKAKALRQPKRIRCSTSCIDGFDPRISRNEETKLTIDQMLEVLNAYKRGEKIEFQCNTYEDFWSVCFSPPIWDFHTYSYRIAKPEPKKIKLQAWMNTFHGAIEYRKLPHGFHDNAEWIRIPEEDKEITLP